MKRAEEINSMSEFKIPENLKVLPNDSLEERNRKRKKLKHLKQRFKNRLIEKDLRGKMGKWSNFNKNAKVKGKGHFMVRKNTKSIFQTPDTIEGKVGVMNSGKGMTKYARKEKFMFGDQLKKRAPE